LDDWTIGQLNKNPACGVTLLEVEVEAKVQRTVWCGECYWLLVIGFWFLVSGFWLFVDMSLKTKPQPSTLFDTANTKNLAILAIPLRS